jgi:hypothetical protein
VIKMSASRRWLGFVLATLACGIFAVGCDDVVADPNFHTWCGDQLCSWKLDSGQIRRAPTWHPKDFGVELLDSTDASRVTAISQVVDKTPRCLTFATVADVSAEAQVSIGVDFGADGTIEYEQTIAATGFREQKTQVTAPAHYVGIRFVIAKKGTGRAVLAQMDVRSADDCTAPPPELNKQVMGTSCSIINGGDACLSGVCCEGLCAECCASPGLVELEDGGQAIGPKTACPDQGVCEPRLPGATHTPGSFLDFGTATVPRQCDPGTRKRPIGAECLFDDDCTSGACAGASSEVVNLAVDGGACPAPPDKSADCTVSSIRAGVCR